MTTCTILVIACLSCPCFFESSRTCSFNRLQSPESLLIVTIATRIRDVDARSEAWEWLADGKEALEAAHLSGLLLQCCELLDRTSDISLDFVSFASKMYARNSVLVPVVQLQESVCQPPWRSPCRA